MSLEVLLPQAHRVVTATDSEDVSAGAPADPPQDGIKLELLASPLARVRRIGGPDPDRLILRGRRDVRLGQDARRPSDIANPVGVTLEGLRKIVGLGFGATVLCQPCASAVTRLRTYL